MIKNPRKNKTLVKAGTESIKDSTKILMPFEYNISSKHKISQK